MARSRYYWRQKRQLAAFVSFVVASRLFSFEPNGTLHIGIGRRGGKEEVVGITNYDNLLRTPRKRPCYIIAENKVDYHYEVIESAIMQYPLPWDTFNCSKEETIADVALAKRNLYTGENEPWKRYFEPHLSGTVRPRSNGDGAIIHFGTVQTIGNYSREYDAYIGISCDSFQYMRWLERYPKLYCVLHGTADPRAFDFKERICWVNPMHPCYFIPSDLPQYPQRLFRQGDKLRLCLKPGSDTSLQFLVDVVKSYEPKDEIAVIIMGRTDLGKTKNVSEVFGNISNLVSIGGDVDYYKFEEEMSKCHVLLPMIHPWEIYGKKYFPWSGDGKLSGYMSQAIGLKLPLLVHEEIRDLYQKHLGAPVWTYTTQNSSDVQSFREAFGTMMKELPEYLLRLQYEKSDLRNFVWHGGK